MAVVESRHRPRRRALLAVTALGVGVLTPLAIGVNPASADASTGGLFVSDQVRVLDTRAATTVGGYTTPMPASRWRTVPVEGVGDLPTTGIAAVVVNFRVSLPSTAGVLNADADGVSTPNTSVAYVTYNAGPTQSNAGTIPVGSDGNIQVRTTSSTNLIIDVQGYYTSGSTTAGGYVPLTPARLVDTQTGVGVAHGQLAAGSVTTIDAGGTAGIPADASALALNVTVANQTAAGYLTAYPVDESKPQVSSNYQAITDSVGLQVGLGATTGHPSAIKLYTSVAADFAVDVIGYFTATSGSGAAFTPTASVAYDTRVAPATTLAADGTVSITIAGVNGVPDIASGLQAVATDVTVIHTGTGSGSIDAWSPDNPEPTSTPTLTYSAASTGTTTNNFAIIPVAVGGTISIHNVGSDPVDLVVNLEGWYVQAPPDPATSVSTDMVINDPASAGVNIDQDTGNYTLAAGTSLAVDPDTGAATIVQNGAALGVLVDMSTGDIATLNPFTHRLADLNESGAIHNGANFNCHCHWKWGWVSGTLYFDKTGTRLFAAGGGWVTALLGVIPSPFAVLIRLYIATLSAMAGASAARGHCFKLKSYGTGGDYTGGFCK